MLGEKAVCAAVSPHLYTLSYIQVLLPNSAAADLSWDHCVWGQSYLSFLHINTCGDIRNCGRIWPSIFLSAFLCSCFLLLLSSSSIYIFIYFFRRRMGFHCLNLFLGHHPSLMTQFCRSKIFITFGVIFKVLTRDVV